MRKILVILVLVLAVNVASGQDVQSVLNRYYAAVGIENVETEFKDKPWKMDMGIDMGFFKMRFQFAVRSESVYRVDILVEGKQMGSMVVDNDVGYYVSQDGKVQTVTDKKKIEEASKISEMLGLLTLNASKYNITYIGKEGDFEILEFKAKDAADSKGERRYSFDSNTGLVAFSNSVMDIEGDSVAVQSVYKDYKKFGNYTLPTLCAPAQEGSTMGFKLYDFEVGCTLDDKLFEKPKE